MNRKIILTVLSTFSRDAKEIIYKCDKGENVTAEWTNEAGLKYLLRDNAEYTDVICLCSAETYKNDYKQRVKEIVPKSLNTHFIPYFANDNARSISNALAEQFQFSSNDTISIDTSGGYRSVVYDLIYLFRYFEYIGVKVEKTVYSSKDYSSPTGRIEEITDTFRMFDLINGAHEFTSPGNPHTLTEYFSHTESQAIHEILDSMKQFYDNISLCRIGKELESSLHNMENAIHQAETIELENDEKRLQELLPVIRRKLFPEQKSKYLGLIKWCLENNLLQQAITIYVEKLPKAYFTELHFLTADFETLEKKSANPGTEIYSDYFITSFSDDLKKKIHDVFDSKGDYIRANRMQRKYMSVSVEKELEDLLKTVIRCRDMFYDDYGNRYFYEPRGRAEQEMLKNTFKEFAFMPKTTDGLLNSIDRFVNLVHPKNEKSAKAERDFKKLKGIEEGIIDKNVTVHIDKDTLSKLRFDYLYMKYVRNQVNHASEKESYDSDYRESFSKINPELYIFPKENSFSARQIREFMSQSVEFIEKNIK